MGIMKDVWWKWYYLSLRAPQQVLLFLKDTIHSFKELYTLLWNPAKKIDNSALKIVAITPCELTLKTETLHITGLMSGASVAPSQLISQCVFRSHFTGSCSWKWVGTICGKRDALPTNDETLNSCFSTVYFSLMSPWSKRNIWNMTVNICIISSIRVFDEHTNHMTAHEIFTALAGANARSYIALHLLYFEKNILGPHYMIIQV